MPNQLLLLPGDLVQLTEDEELDTNDIRRGRWQILNAAGIPYTQPLPTILCPFPAGTVFKLLSYRLTNNQNPLYNAINLLVVRSENKILLPKSRGGTGRRVSIGLPSNIFANWSFERYADRGS